jgi:hypothetical protein
MLDHEDEWGNPISDECYSGDCDICTNLECEHDCHYGNGVDDYDDDEIIIENMLDEDSGRD